MEVLTELQAGMGGRQRTGTHEQPSLAILSISTASNQELAVDLLRSPPFLGLLPKQCYFMGWWHAISGLGLDLLSASLATSSGQSALKSGAKRPPAKEIHFGTLEALLLDSKT